MRYYSTEFPSAERRKRRRELRAAKLRRFRKRRKLAALGLGVGGAVTDSSHASSSRFGQPPPSSTSDTTSTCSSSIPSDHEQPEEVPENEEQRQRALGEVRPDDNSASNLGILENAWEVGFDASLEVPQLDEEASAQQLEPDEPEATSSNSTASSLPITEHQKLKDARDRFARAIAAVKSTSHVSDQAMEKLYKIFAEHVNTVAELLDKKMVTKSYRISLKPIALRDIPTVYSAVMLEHKDADTSSIERISGLIRIPEEYWNLPETSDTRLLRVEAYVLLSDIKAHYTKVHQKLGFSMESIEEDFASSHLGSDGVQESKKGSRTFEVVTIRFGRCIYPWFILNPTIGDPLSKASYRDVLRQVDETVWHLGK